MRLTRFDGGILANVTRTGSGGVRIEGNIARTGILEYQRADGTVSREYRPPEEVFAPEAVASFADVPVTISHPVAADNPSGLITPENISRFAQGHISGAPRRDGDYLAASLILDTADALARVDSSDPRTQLRELSAGYTIDLDPTPGVAPSGERYDAVHRNIRGNHVALLPRGGGRSGAQVALRLDASGCQIPDEGPEVHSPVMADTNPSTAHLDAAMTRIKDLESRLDAANASSAEQTKALAKATGAIDALNATVAQLRDPKRLDALVAERVSVMTAARRILGDSAKLDGLDEHAVRAAVVAKAFPLTKLDGKSAEYVMGLFDIATDPSAPHPGLRNVLKTAQGENRADSHAAGDAKLPTADALFDEVQTSGQRKLRDIGTTKAGAK